MGPRRITNAVRELVQNGTSLINNQTERVHVARLQTYRGAKDWKEVCKELVDFAERTEAKCEIVEHIKDISEGRDVVFIQMQWSGLPDKRDRTWFSVQEFMKIFLMWFKGF